jgi:hypothetical protein
VFRIWTLQAWVSSLRCRILSLTPIRATCLRISTTVLTRQY